MLALPRKTVTLDVMWQIIMNNKYLCTAIDIAGKMILVWFVFSTVRYFYYGRFGEELNMIPKMLNDGQILWFIYDIFKVPIAAVGIFIIIPLLLKGNVWGLVLGICHWLMGYPTNPLWFVVPYEIQVGIDGKATAILRVINYSYSIVTFIILIAFYFYRRSIKKHQTHNQAASPDAHTAARP